MTRQPSLKGAATKKVAHLFKQYTGCGWQAMQWEFPYLRISLRTRGFVVLRPKGRSIAGGGGRLRDGHLGIEEIARPPEIVHLPETLVCRLGGKGRTRSRWPLRPCRGEGRWEGSSSRSGRCLRAILGKPTCLGVAGPAKRKPPLVVAVGYGGVDVGVGGAEPDADPFQFRRAVLAMGLEASFKIDACSNRGLAPTRCYGLLRHGPKVPLGPAWGSAGLLGGPTLDSAPAASALRLPR